MVNYELLMCKCVDKESNLQKKSLASRVMVQAGREYQGAKITLEQRAENCLVSFAGIPRYGIAYDGT